MTPCWSSGRRRHRRPRPPPLPAIAVVFVLFFVWGALADIRVVVNGDALLEGTDKPAGFGAPISDGVRCVAPPY
jgi:hypothetical protein